MIGVISLFENNNTVEIITLIFQIILILLIPSYYILCEYKWQQTIGKLLTKTVVIDEYGNKPDLSTILLRSLIRLVPFEAISCYGDKFSHGWHDRWSKTWVVSKEEVETLKNYKRNKVKPNSATRKPTHNSTKKKLADQCINHPDSIGIALRIKYIAS